MSRDAERAEAIAALLPDTIGLRGSLADPSSLDVDQPGIAINCTGIEDLDAIRRWRRAGWAMIDITASSAYALALAAEPLGGPPLVVGVGLTPGLTSMLARELMLADPDACSVTISCLVGLGENYGDASPRGRSANSDDVSASLMGPRSATSRTPRPSPAPEDSGAAQHGDSTSPTGHS